MTESLSPYFVLFVYFRTVSAGTGVCPARAEAWFNSPNFPNYRTTPGKRKRHIYWKYAGDFGSPIKPHGNFSRVLESEARGAKT